MIKKLLRLFLASVLISVSLTGIQQAENPPQDALRLYVDFDKSIGYFDYVKNNKLPENAAKFVKNIDITRNGQATSRAGFSQYGATPAADVSGGVVNNRNSITVFVSTTSTAWAVVKFNGQYAYAPLGSPSASPHSTITGYNGMTDEINWSGSLYICSSAPGINTIKLNEASPSLGLYQVTVSSIPNGSMFQKHLDRLLVAGTTYVLQINYSEPNLPESFPAQNTITLTGLRQGEVITELGPPLLGNMPIYTNNTTKLLTGTIFPSIANGAGNVSVRPISDDVGCVSHGTAQNLNGGQYFGSNGYQGSEPGIYKFNGSNVEEVTKSMRNYFINNANLNINHPFGFVHLDNYCLVFSTIGSPTLNQIVCVTPEGSPFFMSGTDDPLAANGISSQPVTIDSVKIYNGTYYAVSGTTANSNAGNIQKYAHYSLFSSSNVDALNGNIPWRYTTKDYDFGDKAASHTKTPYAAYLTFDNSPSTFNVTASYDYGVQVTTWVINSSTTYTNANSLIQTVRMTSTTVIDKLIFPRQPSIHFNTVEFDFYGSTYTSLNSLEMFATLDDLK